MAAYLEGRFLEVLAMRDVARGRPFCLVKKTSLDSQRESEIENKASTRADTTLAIQLTAVEEKKVGVVLSDIEH
jgi:hypothetical protein